MAISGWRIHDILIFTPNPQGTVVPQFRVRGSMLVPYYRLGDLAPTFPGAATGAIPPRLPIGHITAGPSASKALNLASVMKSMLFHVSTTDPATFAGVALLFLFVALAASYIPARRATRIDPMAAFRVR